MIQSTLKDTRTEIKINFYKVTAVFILTYASQIREIKMADVKFLRQVKIMG